MKIKKDVEFVAFNDGICSIYKEDEEGVKTYLYNKLCFTKKILGYKRVYTARAVQSDINRVIRIPYVVGIDNFCKAEIEGIVYDIDLTTDVDTTNPPCIDITLRKVGAAR